MFPPIFSDILFPKDVGTCSQNPEKCSHCGGVRTPCSRCSHCSHEKIELYKREKKKNDTAREREKKNALRAIYKKSENIGNTLCFLSIKPFITPFSLLFRVPTHWEHTGNKCGNTCRNNAMFPCSQCRVPLPPLFRCINFTETTSGNTRILGVKNSKFLVIVKFR